MPGEMMNGVQQVDGHDRGGGNYHDGDGDGVITHDEAVGGDHNPVGDDEYENDGFDSQEAKKDLGALEAAKMAIKFLDQAIAKMRKRRKDTGLQIEYDTQEIAYIDKEIAWLREKQGRIARAQAERQEARDKIAIEVEHCVEGFQTMIGNARNLGRTGGKGAKQIMARRHVPKGLPHISNRENV